MNLGRPPLLAAVAKQHPPGAWVGIASPPQIDLEGLHGMAGLGFPGEVLGVLLAGLIASSGLPALALPMGG
jgi:hypothetical protein